MASAEDKLPPAAQRKYLAGLEGEAREMRAREILRRSKLASDDPKAYKDFKTDTDKEGEPIKTKASGWTGKYTKKFGPASGVDDVAKATGIKRSIIQEVYDRGLAAWRTGHRPGAPQHAWAQARLYSFVMGGSSKTADADLAEQAVKYLKEKGAAIQRITDIKGKDA